MIEQSFAFGDHDGLVGTICFPPIEMAPLAKVGVVLFNAGVIHRIGPHRLNVRLARRLAANGIPSIRFDLAGQGDSARSRGNRGFEEQAVSDLREAMDFLESVAKVSRFALFGFCSGGVHSYTTAAIDARVAGLLLYDTYIYPTLWSRINRYIIKFSSGQLGAKTARWMGRKWAGWVASLRAKFLASRTNAGYPQVGPFSTPSKAEFAETLVRLGRNGLKVGMIYSSGYEQYNYRNQFADGFKNFGVSDFVMCEYLPEMDHNGTLMEQQLKLMQIIVGWGIKLNESEGAADKGSLPLAE